jgi:hypothetical protein
MKQKAPCSIRQRVRHAHARGRTSSAAMSGGAKSSVPSSASGEQASATSTTAPTAAQRTATRPARKASAGSAGAYELRSKAMRRGRGARTRKAEVRGGARPRRRHTCESADRGARAQVSRADAASHCAWRAHSLPHVNNLRTSYFRGQPKRQWRGPPPPAVTAPVPGAPSKLHLRPPVVLRRAVSPPVVLVAQRRRRRRHRREACVRRRVERKAHAAVHAVGACAQRARVSARVQSSKSGAIRGTAPAWCAGNWPRGITV